MSTWILIIALQRVSSASARAVATQEFYNQAACESARAQIGREIPFVKTTCVRKD